MMLQCADVLEKLYHDRRIILTHKSGNEIVFASIKKGLFADIALGPSELKRLNLVHEKETIRCSDLDRCNNFSNCSTTEEKMHGSYASLDKLRLLHR